MALIKMEDPRATQNQSYPLENVNEAEVIDRSPSHSYAERSRAIFQTLQKDVDKYDHHINFSAQDDVWEREWRHRSISRFLSQIMHCHRLSRAPGGTQSKCRCLAAGGNLADRTTPETWTIMWAVRANQPLSYWWSWRRSPTVGDSPGRIPLHVPYKITLPIQSSIEGTSKKSQIRGSLPSSSRGGST